MCSVRYCKYLTFITYHSPKRNTHTCSHLHPYAHLILILHTAARVIFIKCNSDLVIHLLKTIQQLLAANTTCGFHSQYPRQGPSKSFLPYLSHFILYLICLSPALSQHLPTSLMLQPDWTVASLCFISHACFCLFPSCLKASLPEICTPQDN